MWWQQYCLVLILIAIVTFVHARSLEGYVKNDKIGAAYRIFYRSKTWPVARDNCEAEGGKLAVPRSEEEFKFIQNLVRGMHYPAITDTKEKLVVWLGLSNFDNYKTWTSVEGDDIRDLGFSRWAGENGQPTSDSPEEPHCAALDALNPGLRDWWCHLSQPYVCKLYLHDSHE